jgi:hypothetical protein
MNKHEDRNELLVILRKYGDFWRMEASDFPKFMNYIKHYFREYEYILEAMSENILYADLSEEDLRVVSVYYGIFSPDVDTLLLAEVYSDPLNLTINNPFTLRICSKTNSESPDFISTKIIFK